jgi:hypothetical protein
MRPTGIGAQRINLAAMPASSRVIARAQVIDQVAVLELAVESLAIGQAAARARVIVRGAELGLAIVRGVVPVLAIVQVEAVPVRSHLRARLAVPLRTKSVIGLHRRGRVPLLAAVEDLAAVAEIMHAQAATEAATVWAAAVRAVAAAPESAAEVAVAIVVAAADAVEADAGDKRKEL